MRWQRLLPLAFGIALVLTALPLGRLWSDGEKTTESTHVQTNHLIDETSPYLRQHATNPVDWYPWGQEALERARKESKPIFLSIGYSACHWCHVMERESFENEEIAAILNKYFIAIKVDREERPDLDEIYMNAVQTMTGGGGWPLSVFLTPDLKPFFGGTYFPPESRYGRPGFKELILKIAELWSSRRDDLKKNAEELSELLAKRSEFSSEGDEIPDETAVEQAAQSLVDRFDSKYGGFGGAPKFPHPMEIELLILYSARTGQKASAEVARSSLLAMGRGGIYDHLAGGFARYSVDERWEVPHFEKMLYDNALLARVLVEATLAIPGSDARELRLYAEQTLDWLLSDMRSKEGGFYSSLDADSEGEEGKYYVWTPREVEAVLGKEASAVFCRAYSVTREGNFEGKSTLHVVEEWTKIAGDLGVSVEELRNQLAGSRKELLLERKKRAPPALDDKVIVSWNALTIRALARAGQVFGREDYVAAASRAADFLLTELRAGDGTLLRTWRKGIAKNPATSEDYGSLIEALVDLYQTTFEVRWLKDARGLAEILIRDFRDVEGGGFFYSAHSIENLFMRPKKVMDGVIPSGNSASLLGIYKLGRVTQDESYQQEAQAGLAAYSGALSSFGQSFSALLLLVDAVHHPAEVALVGRRGDTKLEQMRRAVYASFPQPTVVFRPPAGPEAVEALAVIPWIEAYAELNDEATAYVCEDFNCQAPTNDPVAVARMLR